MSPNVFNASTRLKALLAAVALACSVPAGFAQSATHPASVSLYQFHSSAQEISPISIIVGDDADPSDEGPGGPTPPGGGGVWTPPPVGEKLFNTPGTHSFVIPTGITSISYVQITGGQGGETRRSSTGNGNGGKGGNLRYVNNLKVEPGDVVTVRVSAGGKLRARADAERMPTPTFVKINGTTISEFLDNTNAGTMISSSAWEYEATSVRQGGAGGAGGSSGGGGGGGAAGYTANGGAGGAAAKAGSSSASGGGGGSGGRSISDSYGGSRWRDRGGGGKGGGVGIYTGGSGGNGAAVNTGSIAYWGNDGGNGSVNGSSVYGAGGGGQGTWESINDGYSSGTGGSAGGNGAVRIVWPGAHRQFPAGTAPLLWLQDPNL